MDWFDKSLNQVIQLAMDTKLNKKTTGSWITATDTGNATGKQGVANLASTNTTENKDDEDFLSKWFNLTHPEFSLLIRKFVCPFCRKKHHPIWKCHSIKDIYNIKLIGKITNPPTV